MNVHVGEVNSTIRTVDNGISPELVERLSAVLLVRLRAELEHERRLEAERRLRPALEGVQDLPWEQM